MNARRTPWWHAAIALVLGLGVGAGVAVLGESSGTTLIGTCLLYTSGDRPLDACQLIFRRYAFGARSGRFGTDVDDVRAGGHHGTPMFHGLIRLKRCV